MPSADDLQRGAKLRKARKELGLSQAELARRSGVSIRTLNRAEQHGLFPKTELVIRIALALDEDPDDWVEPTGPGLSDYSIDRLESDYRRQPIEVANLPSERVFSIIRRRLSVTGGSGLLCLCCLSKQGVPATILSEQTVADLILAGMRIVIFLPYPIGDWEGDQRIGESIIARDNALARSYADVSRSAVDLARDYFNAVRQRSGHQNDTSCSSGLKLLVPRIRGLLNLPPPIHEPSPPMYLATGLSNDDAFQEFVGSMQFKDRETNPFWQEYAPEIKRSWKDFFSTAIAHWSKARDKIDWGQPIESWSWVEYDISSLQPPADHHVASIDRIIRNR